MRWFRCLRNTPRWSGEGSSVELFLPEGERGDGKATDVMIPGSGPFSGLGDTVKALLIRAAATFVTLSLTSLLIR